MALYEWRPFIKEQIARVPAKAGVFVLYQLQIPLHADGTSNLRKRLLEARKHYPRATHFAVEVNETADLSQRVTQLQQELSLVRKKGFIGTDLSK